MGVGDQDGINVKDALGWASRHFAVISAGALVFGVTTSALFTVGYLSIFNISLIWIVSYYDILKIGLVITAFALAAMFIFEHTIFTILDMFYLGDNSRNVRINFYIAVSVISMGLSLSIIVDYLHGEYDRAMQRVVMGFIIGIAIMILWSIQTSRYQSRFYKLENLLSLVSMISFTLALSGLYFGYRVKNNIEERQTVFMDDRVIYDAAVVLFTDKYAVLYQSDKSVVIFPSSRIREVRGKSSDFLGFLNGW